MKTGTIVAFPQRSLRGESLAGLKTTRLRINGDVCVGVQMEDLGELCELLGVAKSQVTKVRTDYQGVYLGHFSQNGHASAKGKPKANPQDILKRKYMELCGYNRKAERVRTLKQETTKLRSAIEKCQEQLVDLLRKSEEKQRQLQVVAGTDEASLARFGDEFDQLLKHPDIERLEINGRKVLVYTKPIAINYRQVDYDIGRFKIAIDTLGKDGAVRMMNQTRTVGNNYGDRSCHHPHIDAYGVPCLGNIQEVIPHMIAEHKYAAAVSVCIQYLKSYERSSQYRPYSDIDNWPVAKKKKEGMRNKNAES
jgi:hypothetical protein